MTNTANDELRAKAEVALAHHDPYRICSSGVCPIELFKVAASPERVIALLNENAALVAALGDVNDHFNTQNVPEDVRMLDSWQKYRNGQQVRIGAALASVKEGDA